MAKSAGDALNGALAAPLLNHVSDGVFVVDRDRRIRLFNAAAERITGIAAAEAVGKSCHSLFTGSDEGVDCAMMKRRPCTVQAVFGDGKSRVSGGGVVTFPKGHKRTLNLQAVPLFDAEGQVARVAVILHDVSELHELRQELEDRYEFQHIIGHNHRMREIFTLIEQIAETDATVMIEGESGTGKELVARAIHFGSRRAAKPFVPVNCSSLVETLLESELFGHVRGSFTGAVADKVGRFEAANGGTIFLDEIGDLSPSVQVKLLRVIQERQFERVGESAPRATDVRIIAATNRDLKVLTEKGIFREDLYYRLRVVPIFLPPLRERREDIPLLVTAFVERFRTRMSKPIMSVGEGALARMMDYSWPGNVRELENAIEHAFVRCRGTQIQVEDLPAELRMPLPPVAPERTVAATVVPERQTLRPAEGDERTIILRALNATGGSRVKAAERLGVSRTTLWRRMRELGIVKSSHRLALHDETSFETDASDSNTRETR